MTREATVVCCQSQGWWVRTETIPGNLLQKSKIKGSGFLDPWRWGCPETSVSIRHCMLPNYPQQHTSHLHAGGRRPTALSLFYPQQMSTAAEHDSRQQFQFCLFTTTHCITSNATGVARLRVQQSSSGAAPRCIVCCCISRGRRTELHTTCTTLHMQLVSIWTTCLHVQ